MNRWVNQSLINLGGYSESERLACLRALERKVLWLSVWMIHNANHLRSNGEGIKVGGHQASCASLVTLMTALYFDVLRPQDRVAVKPHASPVFHAIQYLLGRQTRDKLMQFRGLGGAQAYPSRTKDSDDVDFSTGSVGLGAATTIFASLVQDYVQLKRLGPEAAPPKGRMIALVGDAELDEGNVFEALYEGWKHDLRNVWWVIDYNRQSLDAVVENRLFQRIKMIFRNMGWHVVILKYGKRLHEAFSRPGGDALRRWIDDCPNSLYSALVYKGGAAWRTRLERDLGDTPGIRELLNGHGDESLHALMTNLAGHDMESVLEAFHGIKDDTPTCFIAYTIKGYGLPFAGHKDNHAGLLNPDQMEKFKCSMGIRNGAEWEPFEGPDLAKEHLRRFTASVPFAKPMPRRHKASHIEVPETLLPVITKRMSTQEGFGRLLSNLARAESELADRIVTTSPDVTISTNLGAWVSRRGLFGLSSRADVFGEEAVVSAQKWATSPDGQHIELGIAENNFFLLLAALGLSGPLFGARLLPIGTLYDPFIKRGLDALNYACYQGARFLLVATPSGVTLAPEGGAHQSVFTPLIGIGQPGLIAFEPAFVDELAVILNWSFEHMQADDGGSVYLRLSTRSTKQQERSMTPEHRTEIVQGGYWLVPPDDKASIAIVCCGAVTPEAMAAHQEIQEDIPGLGLLVVTSADRLYSGWSAATRSRIKGGNSIAHVEQLLAALSARAKLVTVLDGHPATLSWLGSVKGQSVISLGVDRFGQSGNITDLYREYALDSDAIIDATARACLDMHT